MPPRKGSKEAGPRPGPPPPTTHRIHAECVGDVAAMRHFCAMRSLKLQARPGSRCVERDPRALGDGKAVEHGKGVVAIMAELCQLGRGKGRSIRDVDRERIHMPPVLQEFIVKMGAGGET